MNVNTSNKWIKALWDPSSGIQTNKSNVVLGDIHGPSLRSIDHRLILVDESQVPSRLKLMKGSSSTAESVLLERPAGIVTFVSDMDASNEIPCIAVACGHSLLIYRNMKPYYRFNIPQLDLVQDEVEVWKQMKAGQISKEILIQALQNLKAEHSMRKLSFQSQQLLTLTNEETWYQFIEYIVSKDTKEGGDVPLVNMQITCITTIRRNQSKDSVVEVLIIGTEQNSIYFIDSQAYKVLRHDIIGETPVKLLAIGHYDLEYRVVVCTRGHEVFVLKRNPTHSSSASNEFSTSSFYIREHAFDVIFCANQLVFATRKNRLLFYNVKGKRQNSVQLDEPIVDIERLFYEPRQYDGVLIVLGSEIHLYMNEQLRSDIKMDRPIEWIKFGKMEGEEGVLVIGVLGGGLCIKIFRRVAVIDDKQVLTKKTTRKAIEIPKNSKTFIEQSLRERENPRFLHQIYQRDWFMIKYNTTKAFCNILKSENAQLIPTTESEPILVNYDLLGFGPKFRLIIRMTTTKKQDKRQHWLVILYNSAEYEFSHRLIPVSTLTPNNWSNFAVKITCLNPEKQLNEETVRILLTKGDSSRPVWATTFQLPLSDIFAI